jgi:hypothetical protein
MKIRLRFIVWLVVFILIIVVMYPVLRSQLILNRIRYDSRFAEFKRCILKGYEFEYVDEPRHDIIGWYSQQYRGVRFNFEDTLSTHHITYSYCVYVSLSYNNINSVALEREIPLSKDVTVKKIISDIEKDSSLIQIFKCTDINTCKIDWRYFNYNGIGDTVRYSRKFGVLYAKISHTPHNLSALPHFPEFISLAREKGFSYTDLGSFRYIRHSEIYNNVQHDTWRIQGNIGACAQDILEIGNYGGLLKPQLKWLSLPDTLDPGYLADFAYKKISESNLPTYYIKKNLNLVDKGSMRHADYIKTKGQIIETSRIVGYFTYQWHTDSWIDEIGNGLKLKVYLIAYSNKKQPEMMHIGTSPNNFFEQLTLHIPDNIIDYSTVKRICPGIDSSQISYKFNKQSNIIMVARCGDYQYDINVETGDHSKINMRGVKCDIFPYLQHLYGAAEGIVESRRRGQ